MNLLFLLSANLRGNWIDKGLRGILFGFSGELEDGWNGWIGLWIMKSWDIGSLTALGAIGPLTTHLKRWSRLWRVHWFTCRNWLARLFPFFGEVCLGSNCGCFAQTRLIFLICLDISMFCSILEKRCGGGWYKGLTFFADWPIAWRSSIRGNRSGFLNYLSALTNYLIYDLPKQSYRIILHLHTVYVFT